VKPLALPWYATTGLETFESSKIHRARASFSRMMACFEPAPLEGYQPPEPGDFKPHLEDKMRREILARLPARQLEARRPTRCSCQTWLSAPHCFHKLSAWYCATSRPFAGLSRKSECTSCPSTPPWRKTNRGDHLANTRERNATDVIGLRPGSST